MTDISLSYAKSSRSLVGLCAVDRVARQGNFTRAVAALGTSKPAISQRIRSLELELGVILFKRAPARHFDQRQLASAECYSPVDDATEKLGHVAARTQIETQIRLTAGLAFSSKYSKACGQCETGKYEKRKTKMPKH